MQKIRTIIMGRYFWLAALLVFCVSRIATWLFPFDSDHWIFYYIGRRWVQGATLYVNMWDHKSPLIYGFNGLLYLAFGGSIIWQRIIFTLIALIGLWLFYKTARLLFNSLKIKKPEFTARVITLLFAFLANLSQFTNSGNNNENIGLVFLIATLYCYLLYRSDPPKRQNFLLASGCLAGFVFLFKANFSFLLLPLLIDLIIINYRNIYRLIGGLAIFAFGSLAQLLIWAIYFVHVGTFQQFYIATFTFNSKYIAALGWDIHEPGIAVFLGILCLLLLFFAPFLVRAWRDFRHPNQQLGILVPLLAVSSIIFMISAGTFFSNYFQIAIPYLCLVAGATAEAVLKTRRRLLLTGLAAIAVMMFLISLKQIYNTFYGADATDARNMTTAATYIKDHTTPNDTFFANVYGATFYRLADRNSGSRFISASHPLIDYKYHFGYNFDQEFMADMQHSKSKYVVESSDPSDMYRTENPVLENYIDSHYKLETVISGYDILRRVSSS
jgi:4-amino-4-deoxy-L-arabinose transferase-like glycosyltransferase